MSWPAQALADQGLDVTIIEPGENTGIGGMIRGGRMINVFAPPEVDVVVLQRPSASYLADAIPLLRARGIAVVVDMDDDLGRIHPSNPAFSFMHPTYHPDNNWSHVARACRQATLVTCATSALLPRYAPHGWGRLIHNYLPRHLLALAGRMRTEGFGWAGSLHSHPNDVEGVAGAVARLVREGHRFRVTGPEEGVARAFGIAENQVTCTGNLPFEDWIPAVAKLGVGIAPLADTSFNDSKSWLKPLEYSAAGVAWAASDRVEYRRLARLCGAPLVSKPKQWYPTLKRLLTEKSYREDLAATAHQVAETLTIEEHCWRWASAWQDALTLERKLVHR